MEKETLQILFNPTAGKGKALKKKNKLESILKNMNIPYKLYVTRSEENLRFLIKKIASVNQTIVAAGGDTTINIIINEIKNMKADVSLGILGMGSCNDIAREFVGLPLEGACCILKRRRCKQVDLGVILHEGRDLHYFLGQANIGLGIYVNRFVETIASRRSRLGKNPVLAGIIGIMDAYRKKEISNSLNLNSHTEKIEGDFIVGLISNIRFWVNGMKLCPDSLPDDGLLHACFVDKCSLIRLIYIASKAAKGKHSGLKDVKTIQSPYFEVESDKFFEIQTDGEILQKNNSPMKFKKVGFEIRPKELSIIC
jgi:diacylglycerol kinase (ATP)